MKKFSSYFFFALFFLMIGLLMGWFFYRSQSGARVDHRLIPQVGAPSDAGKLEEAVGFVQENYVRGVEATQLVDDAIAGMMKALDPHSIYISASEMQGMREDMEGSFDGIGIEFSILEDTIYVVTPLKGGPSEELGIQAGDRIVTVDGENVAGIGINNSDVMRYLKGPSGSEVVVGVLRRGEEELIEFEIERDAIPIHSLAYHFMINDQTGYIQLTRFAETTYEEFFEALVELKSQGMENLVLDLRGNPGGYMNMAYRIADEFLSAGKTIVSTKGRIPESQQKYVATSSQNAFERGGLVVLIDYGSASASEIVSGAVQDHDRGLILGVRSFGKGLVQIQHEFEDGSAIRVVISEYFTPSGRTIQKPYDLDDEEYAHEIADRFERGEIYDESKMEVPDSLVFKTASGRTVYGGGGIYPDVFIAPDTSGGSRYLSRLVNKDLFRGFSYPYADANPKLKQRFPRSTDFVEGYTLPPALVDEFVEFAAAHEVEPDSSGLARSRQVIEHRLKAFIGRKLYQDDGFYPVLLKNDPVVQRALELMPVARTLDRTGELVLE